MIIRSIDELIRNRPIIWIDAGAMVNEACRVLDACDVGALPVLRDDRIVGILTGSDVIRRGIARGRDLSVTPVEDLMTPNPITVQPGASLCEALRRMEEGGVLHLPVTLGVQLFGMVRRQDIPQSYRVMRARYVWAKASRASELASGHL